eukprot:TRINITY_DN3855_c0_g1_i3.p1 TRINITY_DN3855_c0_g1~~TRINITY_DN3855_c0_g1_i3.p1  ORF type:complete len:786 (+),score=183.02 TRINITY_DN3855_c0_g1_i3:247-2358(+)
MEDFIRLITDILFDYLLCSHHPVHVLVKGLTWVFNYCWVNDHRDWIDRRADVMTRLEETWVAHSADCTVHHVLVAREFGLKRAVVALAQAQSSADDVPSFGSDVKEMVALATVDDPHVDQFIVRLGSFNADLLRGHLFNKLQQARLRKALKRVQDGNLLPAPPRAVTAGLWFPEELQEADTGPAESVPQVLTQEKRKKKKKKKTKQQTATGVETAGPAQPIESTTAQASTPAAVVVVVGEDVVVEERVDAVDVAVEVGVEAVSAKVAPAADAVLVSHAKARPQLEYDHWRRKEIAPDRVQINRSGKIVRTNHSRVFMDASCDGESVVVKELRSAEPVAQEEEVAMHCGLEHENIVSVIGWYKQEDEYRLVMPRCKNGSLRDVLDDRVTELYLGRCVQIACGIARGMNRFQTSTRLLGLADGCRVMHRDLNPRNVLLDEHFVAKLTDFGSARAFEHTTTMTTSIRTENYIVPEIVIGAAYNESADVFLYSYVLYELLSKRKPFAGLRPDEVQKLARKEMQSNGAICKRPDTNCIPRNIYTQPLIGLMEECWQHDAKKRPTFAKIALDLQELYNAASAKEPPPLLCSDKDQLDLIVRVGNERRSNVQTVFKRIQIDLGLSLDSTDPFDSFCKDFYDQSAVGPMTAQQLCRCVANMNRHFRERSEELRNAVKIHTDQDLAAAVVKRWPLLAQCIYDAYVDCKRALP